MTRYGDLGEDVFRFRWLYLIALVLWAAAHTLRSLVLALGSSLPGRQLHLFGILQYITQRRRRLLRQGGVRRWLPVELLLRERDLAAVPCGPARVVPRRNERLLLLSIVLVLDHLVYLVEVWVLLLAPLPWLEHFVL